MIETLQDSGTRREFETGAHRDMAEGKGDMYSLPAAAIIRISKHYELGAKKYTRLNYQKGIPISSFMDSALRHIFKYLDGMDDEDHLSAAAFNILGAIQMEERNPDMQDIDARKGKNTFPYIESSTPPPARDKCIFCGVELSDSYVCLDCAKKTPKPAESAPTYREVKRMAEIGEWVKIVNEESAEGQYKNGDIGQIISPVRSGGLWTHIAINGISTEVYHFEYVVLEGYTP